ncbi:MAG: radical SAM protein, partial [bacterium]|nr:radical SAM protein [bacterium]
MRFSFFSFIVTRDCNFSCTYCPQEKDSSVMERLTIRRAVDFFFPFFDKECEIYFYGGEPLLVFPQVAAAVELVNEKNASAPADGKRRINYSLTTNGSLLDGAVLEFFSAHNFSLVLSFDGFAHDISRQAGDFERMKARVAEILSYPQIRLEIHSVFTPETIGYFADSLQLLMELGRTSPHRAAPSTHDGGSSPPGGASYPHGGDSFSDGGPTISFAFNTHLPWNESAIGTLEKELQKTGDFLVDFYQRHGHNPLADFRESDGGMFRCEAGKDRLVIDPDENLWGCFMFHDYFKGKENHDLIDRYGFGSLEAFMASHETLYPQVLANHRMLRMDNFFVESDF